MTAPSITVVIVNYNGGAFIQEAVNSLAQQSCKDFELIVFDNASTDGSADTLNLSSLPNAQLVRNPENLGFAGGNNKAAERARGQWLVLLNPDTIAEPDWLEQLLGAAAAHPEHKTFTSAQYDLADASRLDGTGDAYSIYGIPWRGGFGHPVTDIPESGTCFSACGAAAMYDLLLYRKLEGLDERFFCYCEDVDLGFRLQLLGYDCLYVKEAVVRHAGSGISGRASAFTIYHGTRNRTWTYIKNMPMPALILTLPAHFALSIYLLARSSFTPRFVPMLKGLRDGLAGAYGIRRSQRWRVSQPNLTITKLLKRMVWNPISLSQRRSHIRPVPGARRTAREN